MKRPRLSRRWLVPLGILLLPPLSWSMMRALVPMEWARARIVARLGEATGRSVRLEGVRIGLLGGVQLTNLQIGAPGSPESPWLRIHSASMDVSLLQLFLKRVDPTRVDVEGVVLRVERKLDGRLELADLLQTVPPRKETDGPATSARGGDSGAIDPTGLDVYVRGGRVTIIDHPSGSRLDFRGIEGSGTWAGDLVKLHELRGMLNGGSFRMAAQLDRTLPGPRFEGQLKTRRAALGEGMKALGYLVPVLSEAPTALGGKLDLDIHLEGQGSSRDAILGSLIGHGAIRLDPIALDRSKLLAELSTLLEVAPGGRLGSVESDFAIRDRRVRTDNLTVSVGKTPVVMTGWTDFDRRLDYRIQIDRLAQRLPSQARELLADLEIDLRNLSILNVRGTLDALEVTVDKRPMAQRRGVAPNPNRRLDDRHRLRELSRRIRDRILR